jgi:hypothetical protein
LPRGFHVERTAFSGVDNSIPSPGKKIFGTVAVVIPFGRRPRIES